MRRTRDVAKETYNIAKETYNIAKETYIIAKQTYRNTSYAPRRMRKTKIRGGRKKNEKIHNLKYFVHRKHC